MPSKIYITGVAGFLGSHIADAMLQDGHAVVGCDNLLGGTMSNVPDGVEFFELDCNDLDALTNTMRGVDVVYHCAATAYEGLSVFSPYLVTQNIVGASVGVFTAAVICQAKRVVYCSSMARYGANKVPFVETMTPQPEDPYGIGKAACEQYLKTLCEAHGVDWTVAVPHNIYGPRQKYDDPFRNVASIMANLMLQGERPIIYGDGEQKRCFSYVDDCVAPLRAMAFDDRVVGEVINIGPEDEFISINELAAAIAEVIGVDADPIYHDARPLEVSLANCSNQKARRILGYEPRTSLQEGLRSLVGYIKEQGVRPFSYHLPLEIVNERTPRTWKEQLFPSELRDEAQAA